jgi:hypothetical protein
VGCPRRRRSPRVASTRLRLRGAVAALKLADGALVWQRELGTAQYGSGADVRELGFFGGVADYFWGLPGHHGGPKGEINLNHGGRDVYFDDPSGHHFELITKPHGSAA